MPHCRSRSGSNRAFSTALRLPSLGCCSGGEGMTGSFPLGFAAHIRAPGSFYSKSTRIPLPEASGFLFCALQVPTDPTELIVADDARPIHFPQLHATYLSYSSYSFFAFGVRERSRTLLHHRLRWRERSRAQFQHRLRWRVPRFSNLSSISELSEERSDPRTRKRPFLITKNNSKKGGKSACFFPRHGVNCALES